MLPTLLVAGNLTLPNGKLSDEIPIDYIKKWIKSNMDEFGAHTKELTNANRVLIVKSMTGSGKSTAMPVELFRIFRGKSTPKESKFMGRSIICCQPRVLTAMSTARSIASAPWAYDMVMGETISFQTGAGESYKAPGGSLMFATSGVLASQLKVVDDDYIMKKYSIIIVDEAHERSVDSDILLLMLKNFYARNAGNHKLPFLILTSATIEPAEYAKYFNITRDNIISVIGRTFPIEERWPKTDYPNYLEAAFENVKKIVEEDLAKPPASRDNPAEGDIMIFAPGTAESKKLTTLLKEFCELHAIMLLRLDSVSVNTDSISYQLVERPYANLPLLNDISTDQPEYAEKREGYTPLSGTPVYKRLIIATSVAETGLTIASLKYLIDSGWHKSSEYYYPECKGLTNRPTQKSRIKQRMGRVGRLFPGIFIPLYSKKTYEMLEDQQLPDLYTSLYNNIHLLVVNEQLKVKKLKKQAPEFRIEDIDLLNPPSTEHYITANSIAHILGFMNTKQSLFSDEIITTLTNVGEIAARITSQDMPIECIKILLNGLFIHNCSSDDILTLVTIVSRNTSMVELIKKQEDVEKRIHGDKLLLACLPACIKVPSTKDMPFDPTALGGVEYIGDLWKYKFLTVDNYIDLVLIVNKFLSYFEDYAAAIKFCESTGGIYDSFVEIIGTRQSIANELFRVGLVVTNKYTSISNASRGEFMNIVRGLKRALYDGLHTHELELIDSGKDINKYKNKFGEVFVIDPYVPQPYLCKLVRDGKITPDVELPKRLISYIPQLRIKSTDTNTSITYEQIIYNISYTF